LLELIAELFARQLLVIDDEDPQQLTHVMP